MVLEDEINVFQLKKGLGKRFLTQYTPFAKSQGLEGSSSNLYIVLQ